MKTYPEPDEVALMEKAASNLRDKLLIRLLFYSGCRISEVLALAIEDIDFGHFTITIQHLKTSIELSCVGCGQRLGRYHTFCPKCGIKIEKSRAEQKEHRRQRVLPVDSGTLSMIREYVGRGSLILRDGKMLMFRIRRHRAWQIVTECAKNAGLPKLVNPETGKTHYISPHRLRDAFAVHAVKLDDSGDGLRLLQEHLGHRSFNTTARYRKISGAEHQEWYKRLWVKKS